MARSPDLSPDSVTDPSPADAIAASTVPSPDPKLPDPKPVVICVDDERTILDSLKRELRAALGDRCQVETVDDGEEALELIAELREGKLDVALVVSDYIMPGIKGDELLRRIHDMSPNTLKIMLTGHADLEALGSAIRDARLYRYMAKPWQPADLKLTAIEALHSYLQEKKLAEQNALLLKLNESLSRFFPSRFLELLNKDSLADIALSDRVYQRMSVLFSDIRDFTALSERMTPGDNFRFINAYLSRMEPSIARNGGFIDKYMGDAIMALFGGDADDAVAAAVEMLQTLRDYNQTRDRRDRQPLRIGIGINTGYLMLGIVGGANRIDTTAIGDTVNLAARLEELTKVYKVPLIVSQHVFARLKDPTRFALRFIGRVKVKGKMQLVSAFEVFEADEPEQRSLKWQTKSQFERGLVRYYLGHCEAALADLEACLAIAPEDGVARIHRDRVARQLARGCTAPSLDDPESLDWT